MRGGLTPPRTCSIILGGGGAWIQLPPPPWERRAPAPDQWWNLECGACLFVRDAHTVSVPHLERHPISRPRGSIYPSLHGNPPAPPEPHSAQGHAPTPHVKVQVRPAHTQVLTLELAKHHVMSRALAHPQPRRTHTGRSPAPNTPARLLPASPSPAHPTRARRAPHYRPRVSSCACTRRRTPPAHHT